MLQVCKNTNAPPAKAPDSSTQVLALLAFRIFEIFSKSCGAAGTPWVGWMARDDREDVRARESGLFSARERGSAGVFRPFLRGVVVGVHIIRLSKPGWSEVRGLTARRAGPISTGPHFAVNLTTKDRSSHPRWLMSQRSAHPDALAPE
jgi:hypothetical protein